MSSTALSTAPSAGLRGHVLRSGTVTGSSGPATPQSKSSAAARTETPSPGRWRHPKMQELASRRKRNTFDNSNVAAIVANAGAVMLTWTWRSLLSSIPFLHPGDPNLAPTTTTSYLTYAQLTLTTIFLVNIARAIQPLFSLPDNATDIVLSREQRALLGLDPTATPPETPGTHYLTPPKYARSASAASSPASSVASAASGGLGSARSSPASGRTSLFRSPSESVSQHQQQSLWQRKVTSGRRNSLGGSVLGSSIPPGTSAATAVAAHVPAYGDRDAWMLSAGATPPRRDEWRFQSSQGWSGRGRSGSGTSLAQSGTQKASPLSMNLDGTGLWGASTASSSSFGGSAFRPDTPSPVGRSSVPLKNKWLYERGRDERRFG